MDIQLLLTVDNAWSFATALVLMVLYCVPVQIWNPWSCLSKISQKSSKSEIQQSPSLQKCNKPSNHKVTFVSPLPHQPTDTTEVSEITESSENECDIIREVFRTPGTSHLSTPQHQTRPIQVIQPIRLADIPESPCPALNSALKLKNKLLRQDAVCNRTVSSAGSSSAHKHRRSQTMGSFRSIPKAPTPAKLQRIRSQDVQHSSTMQRDSEVLRRLSRVGSPQ
mmetsp:Transcript_12938/g.24572  ORF Transcript_12938/g.24572 Transcript_12938/m.24572 type:complete len:223 (-) Transcript_12938:194-862(-)